MSGAGTLTRVDLLGVPITSGEPHAARAAIAEACAADAPAHVAYANAHTLNLAAGDGDYRAVLRRCALVLNDGIGVDLAARAKGVRLPANLNGSDFTPRLLELAAERGWSVFLLGGRPGVAEQAAARLRDSIPGLEIAGARDGYFAPGDAGAVADAVRASGARIVVVGMGNPIQERWLDAHLDRTGARLGVGVGAFLDFTAGTVARAPRWMNAWGLEWLYRMAQEPRRMWRRYVVGIPLFLGRVARAELGRR